MAHVSASGSLRHSPLVVLSCAHALLGCGCEFPVPASKYRLSTTEAPTPDAGFDAVTPPGAGGATLDAAVPLAQTELARLFSVDDDRCKGRILSQCDKELGRCTDTKGCVELAECTLAGNNPAAEAACVNEHHSSLDAHWAFEYLRGCWTREFETCSVGNVWDCSGHYEALAVSSTELVLSQRLKYLDQADRTADFSVLVCGFLSGCGNPKERLDTDPSGLYSVRLTLSELGPFGKAWNGYRKVTSPGIYASRIEQNIPVWGNRVEVTRVFDTTQVDTLQLLAGAKRPEAVFVQILDCQSAPASHFNISVPTSSSAGIGYPEQPLGTGTRTGGSGSAAIYNLEPGQAHEIVAQRVDEEGSIDGPSLRWALTFAEGDLVYLKMYPVPK